jgi:hypothetical protein
MKREVNRKASVFPHKFSVQELGPLNVEPLLTRYYSARDLINPYSVYAKTKNKFSVRRLGVSEEGDRQANDGSDKAEDLTATGRAGAGPRDHRR